MYPAAVPVRQQTGVEAQRTLEVAGPAIPAVAARVAEKSFPARSYRFCSADDDDSPADDSSTPEDAEPAECAYDWECRYGTLHRKAIDWCGRRGSYGFPVFHTATDRSGETIHGLVYLRRSACTYYQNVPSYKLGLKDRATPVQMLRAARTWATDQGHVGGVANCHRTRHAYPACLNGIIAINAGFADELQVSAATLKLGEAPSIEDVYRKVHDYCRSRPEYASGFPNGNRSDDPYPETLYSIVAIRINAATYKQVPAAELDVDPKFQPERPAEWGK
ncbi:MAG: hypothetical protein R3C19_16325 [Planctomycetaceae bacterium]